MKVKLLKKVRKRFSIEHYPEGVRIGNEFCNYNVFQLTDNGGEYYNTYCELKKEEDEKINFCAKKAKTEKECINILLEVIIERLRKDYSNLGKRGFARIKSSKVWYKN